MATTRELMAIQAKLDKWELEHLREHAADLASQLDAARDHINYLQAELTAEACRADMFMSLNNDLMDVAQVRVGITPQGQMGVLAC